MGKHKTRSSTRAAATVNPVRPHALCGMRPACLILARYAKLVAPIASFAGGSGQGACRRHSERFLRRRVEGHDVPAYGALARAHRRRTIFPGARAVIPVHVKSASLLRGHSYETATFSRQNMNADKMLFALRSCRLETEGLLTMLL